MDPTKYRRILREMEDDLAEVVEAEVQSSAALEEARRQYGVVVARREALQAAIAAVKAVLPKEALSPGVSLPNPVLA